MPSLKELQGQLEATNTEEAGIWKEYRDNGGQMSTERAERVRQLNAQSTDLGKQIDEAKALELMYERHAKAQAEFNRPLNPLETPRNGFDDERQRGSREQQVERKSLGERFTEADNYKAYQGRSKLGMYVDFPGVDLKTLFDRTSLEPYPMRERDVVPYALRRRVVADMIPQTSTTQSAIKYLEQTTFTNNAAPVAEGGTKPESAFAYTTRTVTVEKIAHWVPVTDEELEDVPQARDLINSDLTVGLELAEETQLLTGTGTSPQLQGFLTKTGVQTQAKGADSTPDAVYKAITLVRYTGFADPSAAIFHPNDWQAVRLLQDANGNYIWGSPADEAPERIWGLPVVVTPAITENTALVGDFARYSRIYRRKGITIEVTNSHSDYFIKNLQVILAEERLALVIRRPAAFAKVTGI